MEEQKIQRLNLFATLAGMAAVIFFLVTLAVVIFFPPLPPAGTPPTASLTPAPTRTLTPTLISTPTPSATATPVFLVELISAEYVQPGAGCQVDVTVNVNGETLTGLFHVWNASYDDPAGRVFQAESLPPGLSSGHLLTLDGSQPEFFTITIAARRFVTLATVQPQPTAQLGILCLRAFSVCKRAFSASR